MDMWRQRFVRTHSNSRHRLHPLVHAWRRTSIAALPPQCLEDGPHYLTVRPRVPLAPLGYYRRTVLVPRAHNARAHSLYACLPHHGGAPGMPRRRGPPAHVRQLPLPCGYYNTTPGTKNGLVPLPCTSTHPSGRTDELDCSDRLNSWINCRLISSRRACLPHQRAPAPLHLDAYAHAVLAFCLRRMGIAAHKRLGLQSPPFPRDSKLR